MRGPFSTPITPLPGSLFHADPQEWLLPVALTTTSGARLARVLLDECRRRRIIVPGISCVERMVAQALLDAERHVAEHLTRGLGAGQRQQLDALLLPHAGTNLSDLAWVRQPPGKPGRKTFAVITQRLALLRDIGIDPDIATGIHPERLRRLCQEGARLTAQHVRTLQATRRRATLVATIGSALGADADERAEGVERDCARDGQAGIVPMFGIAAIGDGFDGLPAIDRSPRREQSGPELDQPQIGRDRQYDHDIGFGR